jgi:endonuclease YncB( thermonuclease family)
MSFLWVVLILVFATAPVQASGMLHGQVTHVTDGDSVWIEPATAGAPVELRLEGIDAPEICQAWGPEAKKALAELVLGQQVSVKTSGRDTHGRTLGTLFLGTQNINKTLVQEGHAWSHRYKYDRGPYVADERMAKALSRGFNRDGGAIMPRDFRQQHGPCQSGELPANALGTRTAPATATAAATVPTAARRCDGRTRCSQMTSCAEATWFLKNCPGVEMDGNHDGVPCERQWCKP